MTSRRRFFASALLLTLTLAMLMIVGSVIGAEPVSLRKAVNEPHSADALIFFRLRLPRVLVAALVGATLAIAGATFQSLLRNPLADPFILGVSGGAACAAAAASVSGFSQSAETLTLAAFAGASGATAVVFVLSRRHGRVDMARLLISGLVLNAFFSAVILLVLSFASAGDVAAALRWMMGSLAGAGWRELNVAAVALLISAVVLIFFSSDVRMMEFGDDDARSRGVPVDRVKTIALITASLATGAAVAVSGVIGFVGLLVPHITRIAIKLDYRFVLPLSAIAGASLMVAADTAARALIPPTEFPVGALLALIGVPFFIYVLRRE